ncbi:MAG: 5-histidylcysteine sulfoxide synthase [Hyphomicrobium sp.]|nr:5-histidylcysteine sulfoxide synthase [Hyphomicrobium sp.]
MLKSPLLRTPRLDGSNPEAKRCEIRNDFHATCDRYEQLFEVLAGDAAYYERPIPLRHPLIFYFGHTATFFTNKLVLAGLLETRIDPKLESQCAVGVDEMSWDDLDATHYDWPTVEAVRAYRKKVRSAVDGLIARLPLTLPISWDSPWWPILMGIEHERIHLETSSALIRQHALKHVRQHPAWTPCTDAGEPPENELIAVPSGHVKIGKDWASDTHYGWDNEYGHHESKVSAFRASRMLVSNRAFLAFVNAEGYGEDRWWSEEGRNWRDFAHASHPTFWVRDGESWRLRLMLQEVPMPWNWPAEVNFHEAKAYCDWLAEQRGEPVRLPTEDEWYRLYAVAGLNEATAANNRLDHWASSCPVDRFAHGDFYDVAGNVWQWTETSIYPFDGFRVHPLYDDFTTPTFDERHNLIKGGSWISCGNEALPDARYAFRRHFFQHAGFRYVVGEPAIAPAVSHYETDKLLSEYAEFHYGAEHFGVANFPRALAQLAIEAMGTRKALKALDLGCATGRSTFELARHFERVTGMDFSARFIGLGVQLAEQGVARYTLTEEGELVSYNEHALAEHGLDGIRGKVEFLQGDACNMKPIFSGYDLILAANLIDRLYSPRKFLCDVHTRLNPGGILMIASPYTWLAEHTPREEWLGGFKRDGENVTTLDGLKELLTPHFRLIGEPRQVPFVIRETRRKFQHSLSEVTIWERIA